LASNSPRRRSPRDLVLDGGELVGDAAVADVDEASRAREPGQVVVQAVRHAADGRGAADERTDRPVSSVSALESFAASNAKVPSRLVVMPICAAR